MAKLKTFINHEFYADAGHGWLKVSKARLAKLRILDKITRCSFMRGDYVYLEEDCDYSTYIEALLERELISVDTEEYKKFRREFDTRITYNHTNRSSKIRSYEHFENRSPGETVKLEEIRTVILNLKNWSVKARKQIINAKKDDVMYWKEYYNL